MNGCGAPPFEPLRNCEDAYVAKLGTDGSGLAYGTFLGGGSVDEGSDIVVDASGSAIVVGNSSSTDFVLRR